MHHPLTDVQADFEINRPIRYQITAKINYFHRRQTEGQTDRKTDGRTDGQTDGQTSRKTTIGSFIEKKLLKNKTMYHYKLYTIARLVPNKSIQAVQLIY